MAHLWPIHAKSAVISTSRRSTQRRFAGEQGRPTAGRGGRRQCRAGSGGPKLAKDLLQPPVPDGAAGWRDVAGGAPEDSVLGPGERSLLDGDVVDDVEVVDLDVRVRGRPRTSCRRTRRRPPFPRRAFRLAPRRRRHPRSLPRTRRCRRRVEGVFPFSKASRVVIVIKKPPSVDEVQAEGSRARWAFARGLGTWSFSVEDLG